MFGGYSCGLVMEYSNASMAVGLYQKDVDIIGDFASALNCPTPLFNASRAFYAAALAQGDIDLLDLQLQIGRAWRLIHSPR